MKPAAVVRPPAAGGWFLPGECTQSLRGRIFCFHCAGGSAGQFGRWRTLVSSRIDLRAVQLPGRESRIHEEPARELLLLVEQMGPALAPYMRVPFVIFGHSLGALIAFELTRWLRRSELPLPHHLFVAARAAPHLPQEVFALDTLGAPELLRVLSSYGGVEGAVLRDEGLMSSFLPTIRADFHMARSYVYEYEDPLSCPITAFCGRSDPLCSPLEVEAWCEQTQREFRLLPFDGNHFFIRAQAAAVARHLSDALEPVL